MKINHRRPAFLLLGILLCLHWACRPETQPDSSSIPVVWQPAEADFLLAGRTIELGWSQGMPAGVWEVRLVRGGRPQKEISGPKDLIGEVKIDSSRKALRYARFFTYSDIADLFDPPNWIEIVPARTLDDPTFWRGGHLGLEISPHRSDLRYFGVVSDKEWKASGYPPPKITQTAKGYVVERLLFQLSGEAFTETPVIALVSENISRDGRIERKVLRRSRAKFRFVHFRSTM
jgi:hypothetical protein